MTTIELACAVHGDAWLGHAAAMLNSALRHTAGHPVRVHFMHGPATSSSRVGELAAMVERDGGDLAPLEIPPDRLEGLASTGVGHSTVWYRIFLPELLPDVSRVLYLDADLLVLDSLAPLFELDLAGRHAAAVTNVFERWHLDHPAKIGLPDGVPYFNAGVLLLNLDEMRGDGCDLRLVEYARAHSHELPWLDQDVLNLVLGAGRLSLPPRWNCMNSVVNYPWAAEVFGAEAVEEARSDPAIRHFEGGEWNKPWHYLGDRSWRAVYDRYRRETPWPEYTLEGRTPTNVLRRPLRRPLNALKRSARRVRYRLSA